MPLGMTQLDLSQRGLQSPRGAGYSCYRILSLFLGVMFVSKVLNE